MSFQRLLMIAAAMFAASLLAGCSGGASMSSLSSVFARSKPADNAPAAPATEPVQFECPSVAIRQGASTFAVSANPAEPTPLNLRYQVGFAETARECRLAPGNIVIMRVGVEGRVILGPAGTPGHVDVPLRLAVVREGVTPKTITTKLYRVPVTIPPDDSNVLFRDIEEELTFPMPPGKEIDAYIVYVGFDPLGAHELDRKRPPPSRRSRPPDRANAPGERRAPL
jgi:hypothetical protein